MARLRPYLRLAVGIGRSSVVKGVRQEGVVCVGMVVLVLCVGCQ